MSIRKIITIDEEKCNGCGECIIGCHEGALQIVDGKAKLVKDSYCDGLGDCLGTCPLDAITIVEREADDYDEAAVEAHLENKKKAQEPSPCGCPSMAIKEIKQPEELPPLPCGCPGTAMKQMEVKSSCCSSSSSEEQPSQLSHWPVQISLIPPTAPFLQNADLILAADCVAFAYASFHERFLKGKKPVMVGCPKLDNSETYINKLQTIMETASLKSLTVLRMEVPCCGGMTRIAELALKYSGANVPVKEITISIDGKILSERQI